MFNLRKVFQKSMLGDTQVWQKGESQNGCFKKTKQAKFSEKRTFVTPWYAQVWKKCSFFGKFNLLCFFGRPVLRFDLCAIIDKLCISSVAKDLTKRKRRHFPRAQHLCWKNLKDVKIQNIKIHWRIDPLGSLNMVFSKIFKINAVHVTICS